MVALTAAVLGVPAAWFAVGLVGQSLFFGRFLLQWIASERLRKSIMPMGFWYMSIAGSSVTLAYAIYRADPIFILGQTTGSIVYLRNIYLRRLERRKTS